MNHLIGPRQQLFFSIRQGGIVDVYNVPFAAFSNNTKERKGIFPVARLKKEAAVAGATLPAFKRASNAGERPEEPRHKWEGEEFIL